MNEIDSHTRANCRTGLHGVPKEQLAEDFQRAAERISQTLDGILDAPSDIPVVSVDLPPSGEHQSFGDPEVQDEACYSREDLTQLRHQVLEAEGFADDTPLSIVIQAEAIVCVDNDLESRSTGTAHVVMGDDVEGFGVFTQNSVLSHVDEPLTDYIKAHEFGHSLGLPHALGVAYYGDKNRPISSNAGSIDISAMTSHPGYENGGAYELVTTETADGDIVLDEYAAMGTVMGKHIPHGEEDVFSFMEINHLNADASRIQIVDATEQRSYTISTHDNGTARRGIIFDLPEDHPLRNLVSKDKPLTSMALGLNSPNGDDMAQLTLIGRLSDGTTVTFANGSYIPNIDYHEEDGVIVYTDESLGVRVRATTEKPASGAEESEVTLSFEKIYMHPIDILSGRVLQAETDGVPFLE